MRAVLERYLTLVVVGVIVLLVPGVTWSRGGQTVMRDFVAAQLDVARLHAALADDDPKSTRLHGYVSDAIKPI